MVAKEIIEHNDVRDLVASMSARMFACYTCNGNKLLEIL
jgi:hypothetical protein